MCCRQIPVGVFRTDLFSKPKMDFFDCSNKTIAADFCSFTVNDLCRDTDFATLSFNEIVDLSGSFDASVLIADKTCPRSKPFLDQP